MGEALLYQLYMRTFSNPCFVLGFYLKEQNCYLLSAVPTIDDLVEDIGSKVFLSSIISQFDLPVLA